MKKVLKAMIRLSTIQDIQSFVSIVSMTDMEVDLSSHRYVVDGKSIMGIYSLDLLNPIMLLVYPTANNEGAGEELMEKLQRFVVEKLPTEEIPS
ncbi:MAG: HPr family phosphocarrier protein [Clostridia bacterium]|nr:HPr family phosphocarrier protein [Clostridia bacterium]